MDDEKQASFFEQKFLGETAWRWMGFAVAATIFLFVWGRVINLLADVTE